MPGRLFLHSTLAIAEHLPPGMPADPPRANIAPGQEVLCWAGQGWLRARWGLIPQGRVNARGRPVLDVIVNARSETVFGKSAFSGLSRAVVPADGWYEWTGNAGRKTAWAIRRADGAPVIFAALLHVWTAPDGRQVPQVATITCAPNADVAKVHDRMGAILAPAEVPLWLTLPETEAAALLRPLPEGVLQISKADAVDWSAP